MNFSLDAKHSNTRGMNKRPLETAFKSSPCPASGRHEIGLPDRGRFDQHGLQASR